MASNSLKTPTESKIVCMMDVLGFAGRFETWGLVKMQATYELLIEDLKAQRHMFDLASTPEGHLVMGVGMYENAYFSDTLLHWGPFANPFLGSFVSLVCEALCSGIERDLPLRGTISVGDAVMDAKSGIFLGLPIIEAARAERCQEWIGVSIGHTFADDSVGARFNPAHILPYETQFKNDPQSPWKKFAVELAVDWPRHWRETRASDPRLLVQTMNNDPKKSSYYDKTLRFIDFSEKNHDWFLKTPDLKPG